MLDILCKQGYRLFGGLVHKYRHYFRNLVVELRKALLPYSVEEYIAGILLLCILVFFLSTIFAVIFLVPMMGPAAVVSALTAGICLSALVGVIMLNYPSYRAIQRGKEIDARLAAAVTHMSTLAGTGIAPINIFKAMVKLREYGEIAKECALIVRDVELFGKDLLTALSESARRSPSRKWEELLWGVMSTLRSGGNLRDYFLTKARELMKEFERQEREAMESANVVTEIYLIIAVLAPILAVLMTTVMGLFGGDIIGISPKEVLAVIVYVGVPVTGAFFIAFARMVRPREIV